MKKSKVIIILVIFFSSCSTKTIDKQSCIVFADIHQQEKVWINNSQVYLEELRDKISPSNWYGNISVLFDSKTEHLWCAIYEKNKKQAFLYNITSGVLDTGRPVVIKNVTDGIVHSIYKNKVLIEEKYPKYEIYDLVTSDRSYFELPLIDSKKPTEYPVAPLGLCNDKVVFWNGYYDIVLSDYHFFREILKFPRLSSDSTEIIGLNENNDICIYNFISDSFINTKIERKLSKYTKYKPEDLFYKADNSIYFSKDHINLLSRIFSGFFPIWYKNRTWYRLSLTDGSILELESPTQMVVILGSFNSCL